MNKIYKKFNSFLGIRIKKKYNLNNFLDNLKIILNNKKNLVNLNNHHLEILGLVKKDLFQNKENKKNKFVLSPNVIKEIQTISDDQIAKYLGEGDE